MGTAIKHPVPDRVKQSFVIYDSWYFALQMNNLVHFCVSDMVRARGDLHAGVYME